MQHPAMCVSRPLCGSERTEPTPPHREQSRCRCRGGGTSSQCYGGHGERETPGLIPNPEAKPFSADGTARGTGWESRTPPDIFSRNGGTATAVTPFLHFHPSGFGAETGGSAAAVGWRGRGADVVRQPQVEAGAFAPGLTHLLQRGPLVQPARRLPELRRVQRLVPEQVQARMVGRGAARRPDPPVAVDGPAPAAESNDLVVQSRALHVVRHGP